MLPFPFSVRTLGSGDAALMRAMLTMFGEAFGEVQTYSGSQPTTEYLERLLGSDNFIALAALKDDEVVGGIAAYLAWPVWRGNAPALTLPTKRVG